MNERIKELADQILPNEKEFHQGDPKEWGYFFSGEELEKFAELIVRECEKAAKNSKWYSDNPSNGWRNPINHACEVMKEHFGLDK